MRNPLLLFALLFPSFLVGACSGVAVVPEAAPAPSPAPPLAGTPGGARRDAPRIEEVVGLAGGEAVDAAGAAEAASSDGDTEEPSTRPEALGWVAGGPITAEDLLLVWHQDASQEVFLVVEKLVSIRLALAEAQRLGMRLDPGEVELDVAQARKDIASELAKSDLDLTLEEFVESRLAVRADVYFDRLRQATIRRMLTERSVRAFTLANDSARVRMIVTPTREEIDGLRARFEAGEGFGDLAAEASVDSSAEEGGLVPFLLREEGSPLAVSVFAAQAGDLVGPFAMSGHQVLVLVEELRQPEQGGWDAVGADVEASLAAEGVTDPEFLHWKLEMERRYPIDLGPLKDLLGIRD